LLTVTILIIWVFALCLHEWAHAKVAFLGGDHSVVDKGYCVQSARVRATVQLHRLSHHHPSHRRHSASRRCRSNRTQRIRSREWLSLA
jgi:hypothetical protein